MYRDATKTLNFTQNATLGTYKILGDSLREHPDFLFKKYSQATDLVLNQKGANVEVV